MEVHRWGAGVPSGARKGVPGGSTWVAFGGVDMKADLAILSPCSLLCDLGKPLESANLIFFVSREWNLLLCISEDEMRA